MPSLILTAVLLVTRSAIPTAREEDLLATRSRRGPNAVITAYSSWLDPATGRRAVVKFYVPAARGSYPAVVFSHGLGNSKEGYAYLGEHWASWGIISVHPEYAVAASSRGPAALFFAGWDKSLCEKTASDQRFVLQQLQNARALPPIVRERIDATRIGLAGHSLGACTALAGAGLTRFTSEHAPAADPHVKAVLALSMSEDVPAGAYRRVSVPVMHMTGTNDTSLLYGTTTAKRRIPFDAINGPRQYLITWRGANHSTFSNDARRDLPLVRSGIEAMSTIFWDAWLRNDARAREWLSGDTPQIRLRGLAKVEVK